MFFCLFKTQFFLFILHFISYLFTIFSLPFFSAFSFCSSQFSFGIPVNIPGILLSPPFVFQTMSSFLLFSLHPFVPHLRLVPPMPVSYRRVMPVSPFLSKSTTHEGSHTECSVCVFVCVWGGGFIYF